MAEPKVLASERPVWMGKAKCLGAGAIFHPENNSGVAKAKAICRGLDGSPACPVLQTCLAHALEYDEPGVWGGESERGRKRLRRALKRARLQAQGETEDRQSWGPEAATG